LTIRGRLNLRRIILPACLVLFAIPVFVIWTAIKGDYREALNEGSGQQDETLAAPERVLKLGELIGQLGERQLLEGVEQLVSRIGYVGYFAQTLENIPANMDYSHGFLWWRSIRHVLAPRLLFPNKETLSDSDVTRFCTGTFVAGGDQGTSISVGYMGESYADFGPRWMFIPIFLLGAFYGLIYRYFAYNTRFASLGVSLGCILLIFRAQLFESSNIKLLGGVLSGFLVMVLMEKILAGILVSWIGLREQPQHSVELSAEDEDSELEAEPLVTTTDQL
jgi:hypothetical protein